MDFRLIRRAVQAAKCWDLKRKGAIDCVEVKTGAPGVWYVAINEMYFVRDDLF